MNKLTMLTLSLLLASAGSLFAVRPGQGGRGIYLASSEITITNKGKEPATLRALYFGTTFGEIPSPTKGFETTKVAPGETVHFPLTKQHKTLGIVKPTALKYIDVVYGEKNTADLISEQVISDILARKMNKTTFEINQDAAGTWHAEAR